MLRFIRIYIHLYYQENLRYIKEDTSDNKFQIFITRLRRFNSWITNGSESQTRFLCFWLQNILDKFNPGARQLINAGKAYLKALHGEWIKLNL